MSEQANIEAAGILGDKQEPAPEFKEMIPESYRDKPYLKDVDSLDKLFQNYDNAQSLIGKKTVGVPTEESPIEEWEQFFNKMGRPEDPDKYELDLVELPDEVKRTDEQLGMMKKIFHEAGLTTKQANDILKKTDEAMLQQLESNKGEHEKFMETARKEFVTSMDKHFGEEKDQAIAVTETMLKQYVPKGMEDYVKGLPDNAMLVLSSVLHNMHKAGKGEDRLAKDVTVEPEVTPESMRMQAKNMLASKEFRDQFHPNHEATKRQVAELYKKIAQAQNK